MPTGKDTDLKKYIFERIFQLDEEVVEADPEYQKLGERPHELLKLIAAKLAPEDKELLNVLKSLGDTEMGYIE